jgi:hypothetical protein
MHSPKKPVHRMSNDELSQALFHFEAKRARREAIELLNLVRPNAFALSQLAAQNLKRYKELICRAADEGRTEFFIDLGKTLEGKRRKLNTYSKLDQDVAFILCFDPKIKSPHAVKLLKNLGHPEMSPESFKQMKYNWKRAAAKTRHLLEKAGWKYLGNTFLDDGKA